MENIIYDKKIEQDLESIYNNEPWITEIKPIHFTDFNLYLGKSIGTIVLNYQKNIVFDYPQKNDYYHDGTTTYDIEYNEVEEYYLSLDNMDKTKIARIINSNDGKFIVINPNYLEFIKENVNVINEKMSEKFNEYNMQKSLLNLSEFALITTDDFFSKIEI